MKPANYRFLVLPAMIVFLWVSGAMAVMPPPMTADLEWMGRIVVEFSEDLDAIQVNSESGIALMNEPSLDALASRFGVYNMRKLVPIAQKPDDPSIRDISRYYIVEFPTDFDLHAVAQAYQANASIITAEPYRIHRNDYLPDDPFFVSQWGMAQVDAELAFDYCQGSEEVVVGIVDSGTDTAHVDLRDNLWINPGEDLNGNGVIDPPEWNGLDDDSNGYIDDFWGWNSWWNNNNVQDLQGHGTHCAGDASAVTDNAVGVGSLGFKAKIQTAKAGDGQFIYAGIEGISYCGYNGDADIISCSWGGSWYSGYEQSVINNLWSMGKIVVASAGNDNSSGSHYPSFYNNVVSVAATDQYDQKAGFSNYSSTVDVCAPGVAILNTTPGNTYQSWDGTSFACPITSGLVALVWAAKPEWNNAQVMQQIYATCVDIYPLNPSYIGLLGNGRIDAGAAISTLYPNLSYTEQTFDDAVGGNGNGRPEPGETVDLLLTIENSSASVAAAGVSVSATCSDPDITITSSSSSIGAIAAGGSANNYGDPITFEVDAAAEAHLVTFVLTMTETGMGLTIVEELTQMVGFPDVIVVDDDGGASFESWYELDLTTMGYAYEVWNVDVQGDIPSATLQGYPVAIWHTSNQDDPLSGAEQSAIEDYLANGGNLFLSGEDIDEQLAGTAFYLDVLHATTLSTAGFFTLEGVAGDPISDGHSLTLVGAGGAGNSQSPSSIDPVGPDAYEVYTYTTTALPGCIRWEGTNEKLLYFACNFEAVSGIASTTREEVLENTFAWFDFGSPPPPPPDPPTLLAPGNGATGVEYDPTEFSWNASAGATSYHIQVATDAGFTAIVEEVSVGETSTSLTLNAGTEYFWHVNASNAGGTSDYSSTWSFTTLESTAPAMIVEVTYVSGSPVPAGGGNLYYAIWAENQSGMTLDWDGWVDMVYEGGVQVFTVINREILNFQPGWTVNRPDVMYPVPSDWPGGNYECVAHSGVYPDTVWQQDSFPWIKEGAVDLDFDFEAHLPTAGVEDPFDLSNVVQNGVTIPSEFAVMDAYPNPFNPATTISFALPEAGKVLLNVYDVNGRLVERLVDGYRNTGVHEVTFDGSNLASGIYVYRLKAGQFTASGKMVLMK